MVSVRWVAKQRFQLSFTSSAMSSQPVWRDSTLMDPQESICRFDSLYPDSSLIPYL